MIQIFNQQIFFPVHYPQVLWINRICVQPTSSFIPPVLQSCPSLYLVLENKAEIYMFILPSFTLARFQKHVKQSKKSQHLRKLLKWSQSSRWFLNTTDLTGNWTWAGSSGCDEREMHVNKEWEEESIFSLRSGLCPSHSVIPPRGSGDENNLALKHTGYSRK